MNAEPERLRTLTGVLQDPANQLFLSAVSSWEIAIRHRLGKLTLPEAPASYVPKRMTANGLKGLEIQHVHALAAGDLPSHHRDPFDRLLLAQSEIEDLLLATADAVFSRYTDRVLTP
jgi:PIN domain nuclease of toxin-antitoxin system